MASGLVTVGSRRYAVGLYWENSPGSGRVAQIAREAAKQANQAGQQVGFYAVRPGNKNGRIPQFGLSSGAQGQEGGTPVLAACLAAQIPGSWVGAFRLNEGIAVVVVRDDLIVPDGDVFFTDEAEARDRLIQEIGFGGLQSIYAPEAWSIAGADTIPITLLLEDRKDIRLKAVQIPQKVKMAIIGGIVFFVVVVGAVWYWQEKIAEDAALQAQEQERLRRLQQGIIPGMPQAPPPAPKYVRSWEDKPPALAVIDACYKGLAKISPAVAGWDLNQFKCDGSSISLAWSHEKGISAPPPGAIVGDSAGDARQTVILPPLPKRGAEALVDPEVVIKRYLLQDWPGSIAVLPDDPLPPPPPGYTGPWNPPPPPWVKRSFTVTVSEFPADVEGVLDKLPGVVVNSVSFAPDNPSGEWNIEGVIYENRK